jgi:hypothetical protein
MSDIVNMNATRNHIGSDQDWSLTRSEEMKERKKKKVITIYSKIAL